VFKNIVKCIIKLSSFMKHCEQYSDFLFHFNIHQKCVLYFGFVIRLIYAVECKQSEEGYLKIIKIILHYSEEIFSHIIYYFINRIFYNFIYFLFDAHGIPSVCCGFFLYW